MSQSVDLTKAPDPAPGGGLPADPQTDATAVRKASWLGSLHLGVFLRTALPLIVIIIALSWYTNGRNSAFLSSGNIQDILGTSAVLGILAIGQTFLLVGGQLDLSVGSLVSFIGVLGAKEYADGWSSWEVIVTSLILGALIGLVWGVIVTTLRVPPFILTLGGLGIFSSIAW